MKNTKVIAFYLPQFHEVEENNKWWGEGFTDWKSARDAKPLFSGHVQPRIPFKKRYYNLLNKEVVEWQTQIAKKAHVYGLCYYHYWFGNGKQILEKPAENLLKWKDINQKFCFSWANQSWVRSWSKHNGNAWSSVRDGSDEKDVIDSSGVLLQQVYGGESEWKKHFEYLLPFFLDERYIKVNGKPMFLIHMAKDIPCLEPMMRCFRKWAREAGLPGMHIVGTNAFEEELPCIDASALFEPSYTYRNGKEFIAYRDVLKKIGKETIKFYNYDYVWLKILLRKRNSGTCYLGGFTDFDTTPRHGKNGIVMLGATAHKFARYFRRLIKKARKTGSEFVFVNAWNEWGEGAYLEPDEKNKYEFLLAIKKALEME